MRGLSATLGRTVYLFSHRFLRNRRGRRTELSLTILHVGRFMTY